MLILNTFFMGLLIIITCAAISLCSSQSIQTDDEAQIEKRPAFFVGSRYGRSLPINGQQLHDFHTGSRFGRSQPQRFTIGSRYGKRSIDFLSPLYEENKLTSMSGSDANENKPSNGYYMMSCIYTGIQNFYRCTDTENQQYR